MTDEEFSAFCAEHPDLNFEMSAEGELIVIPLLIPRPASSTLILQRNLGLGQGTAATVTVATPPPGSYFPTAPTALPMLPGH